MKYRLYLGLGDGEIFYEFKSRTVLKEGDTLFIRKKDTSLADYEEKKPGEPDYEARKATIDHKGNFFRIRVFSKSHGYEFKKRRIKAAQLTVCNESIPS